MGIILRTSANLGNANIGTSNLPFSGVGYELNDVVLVIVDFYSNQAATGVKVVSIDGGVGATMNFVQRSRTVLNPAQGNASLYLIKEVWWAVVQATGSNSNLAVNVEMPTTTYGTATVQVWEGCDLLVPFDPNIALPTIASASETGDVTIHDVTGIYTNSTGPMMIASLSSVAGTSTPYTFTEDGGWTLIQSAASPDYLSAGSEYIQESSALSNQTFNLFSGQNTQSFIAYVDAFQAAGPPPVSPVRIAIPMFGA